MSVRDYPDVPRIYVDMDGVAVDFERSMSEFMLTAKELKVIPGAYRNMKPIPGAIDGINKLLDMGIFVMMLTKIPSENPYSASEKIFWLYEHLPRMKDYIIISPDKGCVGTERDFLLDDHPEWANAHNFAGTVIKFGGEKINDNYVENWIELVELFEKVKNGS